MQSKTMNTHEINSSQISSLKIKITQKTTKPQQKVKPKFQQICPTFAQ